MNRIILFRSKRAVKDFPFAEERLNIREQEQFSQSMNGKMS